MTRRRTLVQLPSDLVAEIDKLVGPRKRSEFLVGVATREITRQRLMKVFENQEPIWKDADHPELSDGSEAWIRELRLEAEGRFQQMQNEIE